MSRTPEDGAMTEAADPVRELGRYRDYLLLLARRHFPPDLRALFGVDPSDIVNQTLLLAHRDADQFAGGTGGRYAAWLRGILANQIRTVVRDGRRQQRDVRRLRSLDAEVEASSVRLEAWAADGGLSPPARAERDELALRLASALARLSDDQREAVELRYFHGLTVKAVAARMGRTVPAVGGLVSRGLIRLKELLADPPDPG
ncbi:MAG: RNA polymerase subunit sigma-70 [Isosphaera sp.]|nr:RNA polymerase subunit sigma-70 [Isosphaera sp.]